MHGLSKEMGLRLHTVGELAKLLPKHCKDGDSKNIHTQTGTQTAYHMMLVCYKPVADIFCHQLLYLHVQTEICCTVSS